MTTPEEDGTVGQTTATVTTSVFRPIPIFSQPVFAVTPRYFPPFVPSAAPFTFDVTIARPVHTISQAFASWDEALAYAAQLFNQAQSGQFGVVEPGSQVQITIRDSRGVTRIYPETTASYAPPIYSPPVYPFPISPRVFTAPIFPFRSRFVALAGPYAHLSGSGQLGQRPVEITNGVQRLTKEMRDYAVGVLASMYAAPGLQPDVPAITAASDVFTSYTFYPAATGAPVAPGLPQTTPGSIIVINVDDLVASGQALDAQQAASPIRVVIAPDGQQAATIATAGSEWALLESAPAAAMPVEKKGVSPAVVAGIAAVAVAALLLLS